VVRGGIVEMAGKKSLLKAARIFVIVGALLMIVLGIMSFVGRALSLPFYPPATLAAMAYVLISLLAGIAALALSPKTGTFHWTLVLVAIGIVGGGLGGFLVLIGAVTALITRIT
jgi:hypothetical protein